MENYIDFDDVNNPNTVWCWDTSGDKLSFCVKRLEHIIFGDTDSACLVMPDFMKDMSQDEITEIADFVAEEVNNSFPEFIEKVFNCPTERNQTIKTKREIVSDKSFLLTKKRYIMHVVDDDGKKCDKLKITGVEIKKSDTSVAVRDILVKLTNDLLDGRDIDYVKAHMKKLKKEFIDRPILDIAKPISCKTLKKCQDIYNMTGDMKGFPYQVRAAMFYNSMCTPQDKKIMPGDKVAIIYIRDVRSKYIALPIDTVALPEWFNDLQIDYDTEWEKANKKINNYLTSMGWDVKSLNTKKRQELFGF